ncbi:hypothetical protein Syun_001004 [Stephania yunnanensis]|uniref:RRM domain-containing protein n=1 Tax=Stephania yunnanensis TaxID=152371 RepID=A0AAP0Q7B5_9MAGN
MSAFRLKQPMLFLAVIGVRKLHFPKSIHPSEEALLQVKTDYLEGLAESWEEDKLKKLCEQYGEDEKVQLSRKFLSTRRKDFGFVSFVTRESARACVEGINKAEIGEGDNKVKANLAKPRYIGSDWKEGAKGGYKVRMDGQKTVVEASKMKGNNISKRPQGKGKGVANKQNDRWNKSHYPGSNGKQNDKGEIHGCRLVSTFGNARTSSYTGNVRQHYDMIPAAHALYHMHMEHMAGHLWSTQQQLLDGEHMAGHLWSTQQLLDGVRG